ncbi:QacE family quaternary ammonium compound efflux SMR transporter [Lentzea tibetensis]|uniref:QacE family quaternary ammonium compound efflux SMR transporter n=1 Tax=Lentzea tibetensis TaxID=2591470 RepID=A0A563EY15_9PSEU|nr:SMR family transporter [Lentzea tibetensis]TWP52605.1 QacE family quaternary ammonium compound efflux SMR transporter [Lentzea tibetensis]
MLKWILLSIAVGAEVFATLCLKASNGFTKPLPILGVALGFAVALYLESVVIRLGLPVAITYAIWAGAGIALVAVVSRDPLNLAMVSGIVLITAGVWVVSVAQANA